jgi:hypothetical protein
LDQGWRKWQEAGEDCKMRSFITSTLHQTYEGGQVKDEIGRAYGMHGRDEKCLQYFGWKM